MAERIFRGDATAVKQVDTFTPTNVESTDIFTVTINSKAISYTAVAATPADVTAGLVALLNASTIPEFAEITWADLTGTMTGTADTAGVPFTAVPTATDGGGVDDQTLDQVFTTANNGPNVWSAENFGGTIPGASDVVYIRDSNVSLKYNLDQSGAGNITAVHILAGYTGEISLPKMNNDGVEYAEYRPRNLQLDVTALNIGVGSGPGSGRLQFALATTAPTVSVYKTGNPVEQDFGAVTFSQAVGAIFEIFGGTVDIGTRGEAMTPVSLDATGSSIVRMGSGAVFSGQITLSENASLEYDSVAVTIETRDNATLIKGNGNIATLNAFGARTELNGSGVITTLELGAGSVLSAAANIAGTTISTSTVGRGARIEDPAGKITWSAAYTLKGAGVQDVEHVTKQNVTVKVV